MAYYLRHFFNPDFNHKNLRPESLKDGDVSQHYLGYVQNVVAGQVLAEIIDLNENPDYADYDPKYIFPERVYPIGPNCAPHPLNPARIISTTNGYVFYHKGLITVKRLLNVRQDVNFHTGNVMFTNDVVVHGAVRTGFMVLGNRVLVKGTVEGATVIAENDIVCESGLKGAHTGVLKCGGNVKIPFCENIRIWAKGNVEIEGSCLHSEIYVGGSLMIKGRLQGGSVCANKVVYVQDQIGGGHNTVTKVMMGYDPIQFYQLQTLERKISERHTKLMQMERMLKKKPEILESFDLKIRLLKQKMELLHSARNALLKNFRSNEKDAEKCRLICPGKIRPGLEISIARAFENVNDFLDGLEYRLEEYEIVSKPIAK